MKDFKSKINIVKNWPKRGIVAYDIAPLLGDKKFFSKAIEKLAEPYYGSNKIDAVLGIEARGFVVASALAYRLKTGMVMVRKKGKLPPPTISQKYSFEYASSVLEMAVSQLKEGQRLLIADDTLATGGTVAAVIKLLKKTKVNIIGLSFILEIEHLKGRARIKGYNINSLIKYF